VGRRHFPATVKIGVSSEESTHNAQPQIRLAFSDSDDSYCSARGGFQAGPRLVSDLALADSDLRLS
jgi:hypothetical protein